MGRLSELWDRLKGVDEDTLYNLTHLSTILPPEEFKVIDRLVRTRKVKVDDARFPASARLVGESHYPVLHTVNKEQLALVEQVNKFVHEHIWDEQISGFASRAPAFLEAQVAPAIVGLDHIKRAVSLQLVMPERFHILLLGDPGTGKTDILRSAADLSPISSFGLGSGASKAGLAVMAVGKELQKGLLVQAHNGLACIDELNLMKADDRAALYNAMEKGFVTYDKGAIHEKLAADIRLLATANPAGDQFRGTGIIALKKQLPFDAALLSRFHLLFIVRKPDVKQFRRIATSVLQGDAKPLSKEDTAFIHEYLRRARALEPSMPPVLGEKIVDAVTQIKRREKELLIEVTPRLAKGIVSLSKAHARIELRTSVTQADVDAAIAIVEQSLAVA